MNGLLLLIAAMVLVQTPPVASAPADPLKEFLAHYAKIDQEIKTFRAELLVTTRIPKGKFDNDPDASPTKPRPLPATDLELKGTSHIIYSKPLRGIWKEVRGQRISLPEVVPVAVHWWHAYDGTRHLQMSVEQYKTDWGNDRTEFIIEGKENPLFWATGTLVMGELCFHREHPRQTWSYVGSASGDKHQFRCQIPPAGYAIVTASREPNWRLHRCQWYFEGKLTMDYEFSRWDATPEGFHYPAAWTWTFLQKNAISSHLECRVPLLIINEPVVPTVFAPDFSANIPERRFRDGKTQFIDPWRWRPWHFIVIGIILLLLGTLGLVLWRRRKAMKSATTLGLAVWVCVLCSGFDEPPCDHGCKAVGMLCMGDGTGMQYQEACCVTPPIYAPAGTVSTNECETQKNPDGSIRMTFRRPVTQYTCLCPNDPRPKEGSGGAGDEWIQCELRLCTKAPAGGGL